MHKISAKKQTETIWLIFVVNLQKVLLILHINKRTVSKFNIKIIKHNIFSKNINKISIKIHRWPGCQIDPPTKIKAESLASIVPV